MATPSDCTFRDDEIWVFHNSWRTREFLHIVEKFLSVWYCGWSVNNMVPFKCIGQCAVCSCVLYHKCKVTCEWFYYYKTEKPIQEVQPYVNSHDTLIYLWLEVSVRLGKSHVASCSSMLVSWVESAARRKLFLSEKLATKTCMCPHTVDKGQALGKTLHAIMNWKHPHEFIVWCRKGLIHITVALVRF